MATMLVHYFPLSTICGHGNIVDMNGQINHASEALGRLRQLPFVRDLKYTALKEGREPGFGAKLAVRTPQGRFELAVETRQTVLAGPANSQLIAWVNHLRTDPAQGVIVLAPYIPRIAAQSLMAANINFADAVGNIHLRLGETLNWTCIGVPAPGFASARRPASPAQIQLLFQFVTHPESVNWPLRQLESAAGIGKSKAALVRRQMVAEGLLITKGKQYQLGPGSLLAERLTSGYSQVLRPKLTLGKFRPAEKTIASFLARLRREQPAGVRYALTGGPAADLLQHFYRGQDAPLFVEPATRQIIQQLRLLPDREGPVTILHAFGELVFGETRKQQTIAPPWLIYAELLYSADPRAHEAAAEFRQEFIK